LGQKEKSEKPNSVSRLLKEKVPTGLPREEAQIPRGGEKEDTAELRNAYLLAMGKKKEGKTLIIIAQKSNLRSSEKEKKFGAEQQGILEKKT